MTRKGVANQINRSGYPCIGARVDGVYKSFAVHEVIAVAGGLDLLGPDKEVNHINGIKHDNRIHNLEVVSHLENIRHSFETGLNIGNRGSKHGKAKLSESVVLMIKKELALGIRQSEISKKYGISKSTVNHIKKGRQWSHVIIKGGL